MRIRFDSLVVSLLLVASSSACASSSGATPSAAPSATPSAAAPAAATAPSRDRTVLSREEILRGEYQTAYDAILALRRPWLVERNDRIREPTPTVVYMDDMRMGGLEELRTIPVTRIARIKYYDGTSAYARWGAGHDRGAIQVFMLVPEVRRP